MRIARAQRELADRVAELTARELQIVRLVGTGRNNREIAEELRISEATVKTHLNRAMPKLGVSTRAQAVVIAYETGLVRVGSRLPRDRR
ncbi:response regulator transcription factor [Allokutzneria oryzae]|uniref:Response regulator transcription factor n=1 Tax=Allokutzneria oryzae TaxID=1378989 RepID=A0ABV6A8F1_9PSEU